MVLTRKVGTKRPYPLVLLLYIVTFTVYGYYWWFKVHDEVYRQFELDEEGRDQGTLWLVLGVLFYPLLFVHLGYLVANVRYVRQRLGLQDGITVTGFLGLAITGVSLFFLGYIAVAIAVGIGAVVEEEAARAAEAGAGILAGLMAIAGVVLLIVAYARLQGDLNGVWDGYDQRMRELLNPEPEVPPEAPLTAPVPAPPGP